MVGVRVNKQYFVTIYRPNNSKNLSIYRLYQCSYISDKSRNTRNTL